MPIPRELEKYGVTGAKSPSARRLVATCWGETKVGKTDLMLRTAPRPLLVLNIDRNLEPIEGKYRDDDNLIIKDIKVPLEANQQADKELWNEVKGLYYTATSKSLVRSVTIDTLDALRKLVVRAEVGDMEYGNPSFAKAHGRVKDALRWIFDQAKDCKINLLATHRMEDEYVEGKSRSGAKIQVRSGKRTMAGWEDAKYEAQMLFEMFKDETADGVDKFKLRIIGCNANTDCEGQELTGEEITWANLGMFACPWTKRKDWE